MAVLSFPRHLEIRHGRAHVGHRPGEHGAAIVIPDPPKNLALPYLISHPSPLSGRRCQICFTVARQQGAWNTGKGLDLTLRYFAGTFLSTPGSGPICPEDREGFCLGRTEERASVAFGRCFWGPKDTKARRREGTFTISCHYRTGV